MEKQTFAGITFKPTKYGLVRWSQVEMMLRSGQVECTWWTLRCSQNTVSEASAILRQVEVTGRPSPCSVGRHGAYGNPRYQRQPYIRIHFNSNSFATMYDLSKLPELADGTEVVEVEACVGCEEPPAFGKLYLVVSN